MAAVVQEYEDAGGFQLTPDLISSMRVGRVFNNHKKHITALDIDDSGTYCVTASADESIGVYNCMSGTSDKFTYSKKYGIQLIKFTHVSSAVIHSSTKEDDTIRYLSLHDNRYLVYFRGHKNKVVAMDVSPTDDKFLSGSLDDTVRLWDLRSPDCKAMMNVGGRPCLAFDPQGVVFAVGLNNETISLFDARQFSKGAFATINLPALSSGSGRNDLWTGLKFSSNGRDLLVTTRQDKIYVVDSLEYQLRYTLSGFENNVEMKIEACFSPDGNYIFSGSQNGKIHAWEVETGSKVAELEGHPDAVSCIQFNPKYTMMVSGSACLGFWLPESKIME